MTTQQEKKLFTRSAIALAIAAILQSAPGHAQAVGETVVNPLTGNAETIIAVLEDPPYSVRTQQGNIIWVGPTAVNDTFTMTYRAAVPAQYGAPAIPERPAGTYKITARTLNADGRVIGITYQLVADSPPPAASFDVVKYVGDQGAPGQAGAGEGNVPAPPPGTGNDVNQWLDRQHGKYGDNGSDGWGVEICIFSCWTIGDAADMGGAGLTGPTLQYTINTSPIFIESDDQHGVWVSSRGGDGGKGGNAYGILPAARGGTAGQGGTVNITVNTDVTTTGDGSYGLFAQSRAGAGGGGGTGYGISDAGTGGAAAQGGSATLTNNARVETWGSGAVGMYVQSLGGGGGSSGDSYGIVGLGGDGSEGGHGGAATAVNHGSVETHGVAGHGIFAQSVGGRGGDAGTVGGLAGLGGNGVTGGDGGAVSVTNDGGVTTHNSYAHGIVAQSLGGGGGNGSDAGGIGAIGGSGSSGGKGGTVYVNNDWVDAARFGRIETWGVGSHGILAESIGGGGGNGGSSGGFVGIGGTGTSGGEGRKVEVLNDGTITTHEAFSHGILAHSIGGGGGAGGNGDGLVGIGGSSSGDPNKPSNGGEVLVHNESHGVIHTYGRDSFGILAQSIGGGGGAGAAAGGLGALGGSGSGGGNGTHVRVDNHGVVLTDGNDARGIVAQSIGGGGGSASNSGGAVEIGGSGGGGGNGGAVEVYNHGLISTLRIGADAIFAQSIGGGGGNGASSDGAVGIGGSGDGGGNGGTVRVDNDATIHTSGTRARGIMAESIGGGGGSGGDGGGLVAIGGSGGPGGAAATPDSGDRVDVNNAGAITTGGNQSSAIEARSVGGGGGSGGSTGGAFVTIGGGGGDGGAGGEVHVDNDRNLTTTGSDSHGIYAESVGGGGGNGGSSAALSVFAGAAVGGAGGNASDGGMVVVSGGYDAGGQPLGTIPVIETSGDRAKGVFAQSVGGGGGNGGFAVQATVGYGVGASAAIGGSGGHGGAGKLVDIDARQTIITHGIDSDGLLAQSVGGGGGNGGFAVSFAGAAGDVGSGALAATIGGRGGDGGAGGNVDIDAGGSIATGGDQAEGLIAQSIGGGGGTGGFAITLAAAVSGGGSGAVAAAVGGSGGDGGDSGRVDLDFTGNVSTGGNDATGVLSQAVGGGGGNGGFAISGAVSGAGGGAGAVAVGIGGTGGGGGTGGIVISTINGSIATSGDRSTGFIAQSIGGRGGNGGFSVNGSIAGAGGGAGGVAVGIGGAGGGGGDGSSAQATLNGNATTSGTDSDAVLVQSVGGGGGNGGFSVSVAIAAAGGGAGAAAVGIGGSGGDAGDGKSATGIVVGNLTTTGDGGNALVAQSVGGGGGNGGFAVGGEVSAAGTGAGGAAVGLGGSGGGGGAGGIVSASVTGFTHTSGDHATAIVAQSVGGGGGNGGFSVAGALSAAGSGAGAAAVGLGGSGGTGGSSDQTTLTVIGDTLTEGDFSGGLLAQSVGGGGGNGGFAVAGALSGAGSDAGAVGVGIGGSGGSGANVGGAVLADVRGNVVTRGDHSTALTAQSIGGGGGNGGFSVGGAMSGAGGNSGAVSVGIGGSGGAGGSGAAASGVLRGDVQTQGHDSDGVLVQSIGGGGGNGGFAVAGSLSGAGSNSGAVAVGIGASGGGAGHGDAVLADITGNVYTSGDNANAIIAQSLGGGGGNGGFSVGGSLSGAGGISGAVSVGLGGSGGDGGNGGTVTATVVGDANTQGLDATAVIVQSLGGGGGNGGFNVTGSVAGSGQGAGGVAVGFGGSGGGGGDAKLTTLTLDGDVTTAGDRSGGILVQSLGGGGGNGGMNVSGALAGSGQGAGAVSVGFGGAGGDGGDGEAVVSTVTGNVSTGGQAAAGYVAQSLGGGGGNGGMNVSGALSASGKGAGSVAVGFGGAGGDGGDGRAVTASITGDVATQGDDSNGVLFQSVGGGGGNGGMNVSAAIAAANSGAGTLAVGVGGAGGGGGDGAAVLGNVDGNTSTAGDRSFGVLMQSIGGGGGNGGMNIGAALTLSKGAGGAVGVGVGGFGGDGGQASTVTGSVVGEVHTAGAGSTGVLAQSIGGGGGNGGMNIAAGVSLTKDSGAAAAIGVGGFGGGGGRGDAVTLTRSGLTTTNGANADGVVAQSIGGGGGNGGMNISGALSGTSTGTVFSAALGLGGFGGGGGAGSDVTAHVDGSVIALGHGAVRYTIEDNLLRRSIDDGSNGVLAQSVGGSGGNGAINVSGGIALASPSQGHSYGLSAGVGGFGGAGGDAGNVSLDLTGEVVGAAGDRRFGVGAQSIGGSGGNGGLNVSGGVVMDGQLVAGVGGFGGAGGTAGDVEASATTDITAVGAGAIGFLAQSVGGGGGNGGINISGGLQASRQGEKPSLVFGIGGFGGAGNISGTVDATQHGDIDVQGVNSIGVLAQSVAGGGGNGALNVSGNVALGKGYEASIGVGGSGGAGANAARVALTSDGNIRVDGRELIDAPIDPNYDPSAFDVAQMDFRERANGILAQSVGGGGGNGGMSVSGVVAQGGNPIVVGVGGKGAGGGNAGAVNVQRGLTEAGTLRTLGNNANGITAQSVGGGGGNAGMNFLFSQSGSSGGSGGGSGGSDSGSGSGGSGGGSSASTKTLMVGVGGDGGSPGHGDAVDVTHVGNIITEGGHSYGVLAQSVGGGGGNATYNVGVGNNPDATAVNVAVGGGAGDGGNGSTVTVDHLGDITTLGTTSTAIFAQSVGGGGGNTGMDMVTSPRSAKGVDVGIGREGGTGGTAGDVTVHSSGALATRGDRSVGIRAQSVGNGGGESSSSSIEFSGEGEGKEGQDWSASLEVGLEGGAGGESGDVEVSAAGSIETHGIAAHGIHAQSVGGGGGVGGALERHGLMEAANQFSIGVGGDGGEGGRAGTVRVGNDASILTRGNDSHGVFAQSIGGGGGQGGYIATLDLETGGGTGGNVVSLQMGGTGGIGSTADRVDVVNTGTIVTTGRRSFGIDAQSLGGGGGEGGAIISAGISRGDTTRNLSVNVGGSGDDGGDGAAVTVLNEGRVATSGDESIGIRAQSVGGKGGDGGLLMELGVIAVSSNSEATNVALKVGGDAGTGGTGGDVTVTNRAVGGNADSGIVTTAGRQAHGIFAQSLGGGGGNGSSILTANAGASARGQATLVNLSVGGTGGTGGTAGDVTVNNEATIDTAGTEAHGVFAQSVGGGGGNGGLVISANAVLATGDVPNEGLISLGGSGGTGNDAGNVVVNNSGQIITRGAHANGVFAQSIGGGGGNAGVGFGGSTNPASTVIAGTLSAAFGGRGGSGGEGGYVTVNHSGDVTVLGASSHAVVAESINGGGGHVALDFNGVTSLPGVPDQIFNGIPLPHGSETRTVLEFTGGGDHQQNSNAGRVNLNYTGSFGVAGNNGAANAVQAIGGGGGTFDLNLALDDVAGSADDVDIQGRLGGVEGSNNRGGEIQSRHDGDLVTEGDNTPGALVQSIGGGGGRANIDISSQFGSLGSADLALGGENGSGEAGGDIEHTQAGSTSTQGAAAHGGVFQSVGGGGGSASLMVGSDSAGGSSSLGHKAYKSALEVSSGSSRLSLGSLGGSLLDGGQVTLTLDGGVATRGDSALGLVFQSVGAGGGMSSVLGLGQLAVTIGGSAGASGDGGDLEVTNTGDVYTEGQRAHGVFLQSIGGGGGTVFTDAQAPVVTTAADNTGSGGRIDFHQNGSIAALGNDAYALFAQSVGGGGGFVDGAFAGSAGGAGSAGSIDLALNGDIAALGDGSTGLFAQSTGADGLGGNITATLAAGKQLVGGTGGVAAYFDGGAANHFANHGIMRTLSGPLGYAFRGGAGDDQVDNHGAIMGNIDLGGGANGLVNHAGAALYSGTTINLGDAANQLINDGLLSPGAERLAVATQLFGSYLQSATGTADMEIDSATRATDRLIATGAVSVSGQISLALLNTYAIRSGTTWQPLFNGARGVSSAGVALRAPDSVVIDYDLYRYPTELGVAYDVDFAAHSKLSGNRAAVGEYLNRVTRLGGSTGVGDVIATAVAQTDIDVYAAMLTQLDTEFYAEQQAIALYGTQRFARNLQNCGTLDIGESTGDANGCVWARYDDNPTSRETDGGFPAAESSGSSISTGLQKPMEGGWTVGVALDFEDNASRGYDGLWSAEGRFIQLGGSARRDFGPGSFGATLQFGTQGQDVTRMVGVTNVYEARGSRDVHFFTSVLDYTWNFESGGFAVQPSVNLGTSYLSFGSMAEQGAGGQSAVIAGGNESHLWVEPAVGARYTASFASGATLRTFVRAGVLQYLSGTSTGVRAGLAGGPDYADYMRIGSGLDRTHVVGEAGLQYRATGGFTLGLSYSHQQSEFREGGAGSLRFALPLQ